MAAVGPFESTVTCFNKKIKLKKVNYGTRTGGIILTESIFTENIWV